MVEDVISEPATYTTLPCTASVMARTIAIEGSRWVPYPVYLPRSRAGSMTVARNVGTAVSTVQSCNETRTSTESSRSTRSRTSGSATVLRSTSGNGTPSRTLAIFQLVVAWQLKPTPAYGYVSGIVSILLAAAIWMGLPGSAAWVIGTLVGVSFVVQGAWLYALSKTLRA